MFALRYVLEFVLLGTELNILTYICDCFRKYIFHALSYMGVGILVASSIFYKMNGKTKKPEAHEYEKIPDHSGIV